MAKKAPAKPPAKRKPRAKKPVDVPIVDPTDYGTPVEFPAWLAGGLKAIALLVLGSLGGIWAAGGIDIGPGPVVRNDVLQQSYDADRITQAAVLRDLGKQPFDGSTTDGKIAAQDWFNVQRFRNRPKDYGPYTEAVAEAIDANSEEALAAKLEGK